MKFIRYTRRDGDDFGISSIQLVQALSDFFLHGNRERQDSDFEEMNSRSLDDLQKAVREALASGRLFDDDDLEAMMAKLHRLPPERIDQLVDRLIEKLANEGYVKVNGQQARRGNDDPAAPRGSAGEDRSQRPIRFNLTDKCVDFLSCKTLKDLLGALGQAGWGRHDTRKPATGIETSGSSKPYEFGDAFNLDISETLTHAARRQGLGPPVDLDYSDLMVRQSEYRSSCATVLMLDCSHSMILYGEDRFTPAKRVALALSHLIRTQYPGDSLHLVLFHDSAEEMSLGELARAQVGPYYTNTRQGLIVAQSILRRQRKDMRQIIMITDGKPSALTLDDGRVYKNPFGLDPLVVGRTLEEAHKCKRQGIPIHTFMLARDRFLVQFVRKVTRIGRGKAYFTTPRNLGRYLLMDYIHRKTKMVH